MKRIYTFGHEQVDRNITVGDMLDNKKNDIKMTQVTAGNQEEAEIVASQDIDMIITGSDWYQDVRKGAPNTFITAALFAGRFVTNEEILRGAFDVMMNGADSVLTPRSMEVVEMLAKEGMQVQGHVGMVPSMATKYGGIRTVGKTADEAISILKDMKRLEDAGADAIMPLAAPIGSGLGIQNKVNIQIIRKQTKLPLIIDAGLGQASDATIAMELGCDGVLVNTAIAKAKKPFDMALAFKNAVIAGRQSFLAGRIDKYLYGNASSPKIGIIK